MDFNALIATISSYVPSASAFLAQTIVSAFITAMFTHRSGKKIAIYEAKVDFLDQIIIDLHKSNMITATEFLKCKNLSDIAKLADQAREKQAGNRDRVKGEEQENRTYDFDWFWRFFERAGYASNEDMKKLWAAVLNGEIQNSGQFSYKAIETLFHMSPVEASVFKEMAQYSIVTPFGECLLPGSEELYETHDVTAPCAVNGQSDIYAVLAAAYGITNEKIMYLDEYNLLSSLLTNCSFSVTHDPIFITNDYYVIQIRLVDSCNMESLEFDVSGHRFSSVARQLFSVIEVEPSLNGFLDYARLIKRRYTEMEVKVYQIIAFENGDILFDDSVDFLQVPENESKTRLQYLGEFDLT